MKILVVGASSFIGFRLFNYLNDLTKYTVKGTYYKNNKNSQFQYLDITDKKSLELNLIAIKPDVVIWVAGTKDLKLCEANIDAAKKLNTLPVKDYIEISKKLELQEHFIFLSTDYVFDGEKGQYQDVDKPKPNTNYGRSNYFAEKAIKKSHLRFSIIRTSAVMGRGGAFFDWITAEMKENKSIKLLNDSFFTPTAVGFLLENMEYIIFNAKLGLFNICGNRKLSRYEFVKELKGVSNAFVAKLIPVNSIEELTFNQSDYSMIASSVCEQFNEKSLLSYMKDESTFVSTI